MAKRAIESFVERRTRRAVREGASFADDHPLVRDYPGFFEDIDNPEQATAAPGERRSLGARSRQTKREAEAKATKRDKES